MLAYFLGSEEDPGEQMGEAAGRAMRSSPKKAPADPPFATLLVWLCLYQALP